MTEKQILDDSSMDLIFRHARTYNGWLDKPVTDVMLQAVYDLMKWGPTSANCSPLRFIFVKTDEAREKLKPALMEGNVDKTMAAPATAILINDLEFYEKLPTLFPHTNARDWFAGKPDFIAETAMRNGSLQGAYFIIAARSLGLDCGPMSGFNKSRVKEAFFPEENWEANFLCNIGYGDPESLFQRSPRLGFDDACEIL